MQLLLWKDKNINSLWIAREHKTLSRSELAQWLGHTHGDSLIVEMTFFLFFFFF